MVKLLLILFASLCLTAGCIDAPLESGQTSEARQPGSVPNAYEARVTSVEQLEVLLEDPTQQLFCEILSGSRVHCRWFPDGEVCSIICDPDGNCLTYCY